MTGLDIAGMRRPRRRTFGQAFSLLLAATTVVHGTASHSAPPLAWEEEELVVAPAAQAKEARFVFRAVNRTTETIHVLAISSTCGCTVADLPPLPAAPYALAPGAKLELVVRMDLAGKAGTLAKLVTVQTSVGSYPLRVRADLPLPAFRAERVENLLTAAANPAAIFQGTCAACHAAPAAGKQGAELYTAVCAICHDANPRAPMVPDLDQARTPRDLAFWERWVTTGAPQGLMPGFAQANGGPLDAAQIASLVEYLHARYPDGREAKAEAAKE